MLLRVQALTALLQQALKAGQDQAAQPLPALAVTLAATQVQVTPHSCVTQFICHHAMGSAIALPFDLHRF